VERYGQALTATSFTNRACSNGKYCFDVGGEIGGPIIKDRLWFYAAFNPQTSWRRWDRSVRSQVDEDQDGLPDVDPNGVGCPKYLASRDLCAGKQPPAKTTTLGTTRYSGETTRYNFITKLAYRINADNDLTFSLIGEPGSDSGPSMVRYSGQIAAAESTVDSATYDLSLRYLGKFLKRKLQVEATVAYHRENSTTTPGADVANMPLVSHLPSRSLYEYNTSRDAFPLACSDGSAQDKYPGITNCPIENFDTGGLGDIDTYKKVDRLNVMLRATAFVRAAGHHAIKVGFDPQVTSFVDDRTYTAGALYQESLEGGLPTLTTYRQYATDLSVNLGCAAANQRPYYETDPVTGRITGQKTLCVTPVFHSDSLTNEYAAFLQDQWSILPNLTLNAGVRWEGFQVMGRDGYKGITIWDNWAPRIGVVYDWTNEGKAKVYGSYGRFFESMPLAINDRAFSAEGFNQEQWSYQNSAQMTGACGAFASMNPNTCKPSGLSSTGDAAVGVYRQLSSGEHEAVMPGLKAQRTDEVVLGAQYEVLKDLVVGAAYHRRWYGQTIEDISADYGNTYVIANPGDINTGALDAEIQKLEGKADAVSQDRLAKLKEFKDALPVLQKFPKAERNYNALEITAGKRFSRTWYVNASYVYARTIGNYGGLYSATNAQYDPNITTAFDLKDVIINTKGPLPQDTPHTFLVSGYKSWRTSPRGTLVTGLTFRTQSGYPINVLGQHPAAGVDEVFILPRGSGGRTPWFWVVDLSLRYQHELKKDMTLGVSLDVFNLFDQHEAVLVSETYTVDEGTSINNGSVADLKHYKNNAGLPVTTASNYGQATAYQTPLAGRFGLRLTF
jgi:hypothetical protein